MTEEIPEDMMGEDMPKVEGTNIVERADRRWCPYPKCGFSGSDDEVDEHRSHAHQNEAQQGSNLKSPPP